MPKYDIAFLVTVEADTYDAALRDAGYIEKGLAAVEDDFTVSAVFDYELDNEGQRVLYLHNTDEPGE